MSLSRTSRSQAGFTFIELLIVVAIIGILAAIAIPNLIAAIQRSRQSRTMADIRMISEGVEAYQNDHSAYPVVNNGTVAALGSHLEIYIRKFNSLDGWGEPIFYDSDGSHYTVISFGWEGSPLCRMLPAPPPPSMPTSFLPTGTSCSGRRARRRTDPDDAQRHSDVTSVPLGDGLRIQTRGAFRGRCVRFVAPASRRHRVGQREWEILGLDTI